MSTEPKLETPADGESVSYEAAIPADRAPFADAAGLLPDTEVRASYRRLARLCDIAQALFTADDPLAIFRSVLTALTELLDVERAVVATFEHGVMVPRATHGFGSDEPADLGISKTILSRVRDHGEAVLSLDARMEPRFARAESVLIQNLRSVLCCPLGARDPVGVIYVDNSRYDGAFSRDDLRFVHALAHYATLALHSAATLAEERDLGRARCDSIFRAYGPDHVLVGQSAALGNVHSIVRRVANSAAPVLVVGETGTGKEIVARAIHQEGDRRTGPFVPVNMGILARETAVSELFGHERGSFTGATTSRVGLFQQATGGVLFLDEISAATLEVQVMLLRALQEGCVRPMGSKHEVPVDTRVVAACNVDLEAQIQAGRFREDLYYRLNVVRIEVPPLRARPEDVEPLLDHFLARYAPEKRLAPGARAALRAHPWPGNVRALRNLVESLAILVPGDEIRLEDLPRAVRGETESQPTEISGVESLRSVVERAERLQIVRALDHTGGHRERAIELLGIARATFYQKLRQYGLTDYGVMRTAGPARPIVDPPS